MKNILVIDDNEMIRNLIATVLTTYGFTVQEAANGKMGVQMIREQKPDLVICDVNMPAWMVTKPSALSASPPPPLPFPLSS